MKKIKFIILIGIIIGFTNFYPSYNSSFNKSDILSYEINPKKQELKFYWKNNQEKNYVNFQKLKNEIEIENRELVFAMNGGMFNRDLSPQGLFIEDGEIQNKLDTKEKGYGNFYMQPNGVFYLTDNNIPFITTSKQLLSTNNIKYATQSGPMLLIDGKLHPRFNKGSSNLHNRNGVGILPNGNILFAMSKVKINFFDFASFFKKKGCKNALYLDGFVSRTYLPSKNWKQLDGKFGVIIAETRIKK